MQWEMLGAESERGEIISQDNFSTDFDCVNTAFESNTDTVLYSALTAQDHHHDDE